jgi:hypothetical protein
LKTKSKPVDFFSTIGKFKNMAKINLSKLNQSVLISSKFASRKEIFLDFSLTSSDLIKHQEGGFS